MKIYSQILIFVVLGLMIGCSLPTDYENMKSFHNSSWHKDSIVVFNVDLSGDNELYDINWNVRNVGNYAYSNLWLFIAIYAPDGAVVKDTVELTLAEKNGRWLGRGIGDLYGNQFLYRSAIPFNQEGEYCFEVKQGMRKDQLEGIHDFGISIKQSKNNSGKE